MSKNTLVSVLAILAAAAALASLYLTERAPKIELHPYEALGEVAAEQTVKLPGNKGQIVVIIKDSSEIKYPAQTAQMKSFQDTLKKKSGLTIAAIEKVKMDPMTAMATGGGVPGDQFLDIMRRHPNIGAVVLFVGFPQLADHDFEALKKSNTKFVVVSGCLPGYKKLLQSQTIHLAIVPRFDDRSETARKPKTLREWFDQEYLVVTPATAAFLPY